MLDEYTVNTVRVSKMMLGFGVFAVSLYLDIIGRGRYVNGWWTPYDPWTRGLTCEAQKQLPYWIYAISIHMCLTPLLDTYLIFVTTRKEFLMNSYTAAGYYFLVGGGGRAVIQWNIQNSKLRTGAPQT